jgi:branched-chain amino acid transport system permease protein
MLLAAALGGCAGALDGEQLRLCRRVIPALHPEATEIREVRAAPAALGRQAVRIEYAAREPGTAAAITRHIACGFGGATFDPARLDLVAVETGEGLLGEARLLYLKRFWLADPATAPVPPSDVPQVSTAVAYAAQQLVSALAPCAIYALLATAYSLIYGLVGRINLAFGQIAVVGAFSAVGALAAARLCGLADPTAALMVALLFAAAVAALWSGFVGRTVVAPLHARHRLGQPILVATAAVAITLEEMLRLSQGARDRWIPALFNEPLALAAAGPFVVTVTPAQLGVALAALAAAAAVLVLLGRTRFGRHWRAFADDPVAAALFGVSPGRLLALTFVLAGLLAGLAGWIVAVYYGNVGFAMGTMLGLKALVAAVVGGIGSVPGAFVGGILVGLVEGLWSAYFDIATRDIVVYAILIVVFVLRPGGLLGFAGPRPREV